MILFIYDNSENNSLKEALAQVHCIFEIDFIQSPQNIGFGRGHNHNLKRAQQAELDYFWVLNSDCIVACDAITHLISQLERVTIPTVLGSTIVNSNTGNVETAGGCRYYPLLTYARNFYEGETPDRVVSFKEPSYDYLYGASLFFNGAAIGSLVDKSKIFDEDFFLYFEEIDFFYRYKEKIKMGWCKKSFVYHLGGASTNTGQSNKHNTISLTNAVRSSLVFSKKHYLKYFIIIAITSFLLRALQLVLQRNHRLLKTLFCVYRDFLFNKRDSNDDF